MTKKFLSLRLFQRMKIVFDPFHPQTKLARHLVLLSASPRWKGVNPRCQVAIDLKRDRSPPKLELLTFTGETVVIDAAKYTLPSLIEEMEFRTLDLFEDLDVDPEFDEAKSDPEGDE